MKNYQEIKIKVYEAPNGKQPFTEWLNSIKDKNFKRRIINRLDRIKSGNLGRL